MIYFIDDFLDKDLFEKTTQRLNSNSYVEYETPGKSFWIQESNNDFNDYVLQKLQKTEGNKLENILGFFRISNDVVDTNWRIHSDLNIQGEQPDRAEAENLDMWTLDSVVGYGENRAISYPASYFHSKYPNVSWKEGRQVFVMFYKIK